MNTDWALFSNIASERTVAVVANPHTFVQNVVKVFTIGIEYNSEAQNSITLHYDSALNFVYNDQDKFPEICDMLDNIRFVELQTDPKCHQPRATELYRRAAIIRASRHKNDEHLKEYNHKCVPSIESPWKGEYEEGKLYYISPSMDLSRLSIISLEYDIPDNIGDYQFYYVNADDCNVEKLLKVNTEILHVWASNYVPHDWYRLLAKVKYFMLYASNAIVPDPPNDIKCDNLLDYEIIDRHVRRWDVLEKICEPSPARFGKTKSARS